MAPTATDDTAPDALAGAPHPAETALGGRLFGQAAPERAFLAAWGAGRLHHAWLIAGPRGTGKATLAYRIARARLAEADPPATLDPPPGCAVARRILAGSEARLAVLRRTPSERTGKLRKEIAVDDVRALKRGLALSVPDAGWRAVIVDAADEMTPSAANALLKALEEPPERTLLLLVAHLPGAVLPTIRSRCRRLATARLGAEDLAAALAQAGHGVATGEAAALEALADGSAGEAIRYASAGGPQLYASMLELLRPGGVDRAGLAALAERVGGRERDTLFPLAVDLVQLLLGRLARAGVLGPPAVEAAPGEAPAMAALSAVPAETWAAAAERLARTGREARAVNLDPSQAILDMFLDLDAPLAAAGRAPRRASGR